MKSHKAKASSRHRECQTADANRLKDRPLDRQEPIIVGAEERTTSREGELRRGPWIDRGHADTIIPARLTFFHSDFTAGPGVSPDHGKRWCQSWL